MANDYSFLRKTIFCIFGMNMTGKSVLAKDIAYNTKSIVFDVHKEYDTKKCDVWQAKEKFFPGIQGEFDGFLQKVTGNKWNVGIFDEADRYIPNQKAMGNVFAAYLGDYRHRKLDTCGFICRRPTQINTNIPELARYIFIFRLAGRNDLRYLDDIAVGLSDAVRGLEKFHYVQVNPDRTFEVKPPIKI